MSQVREFSATGDQRRIVRVMSGYGIPPEQVALLLEIHPLTLRQHFRRELDSGPVEATAKVGQTLFQMATCGNNTAASIFWMKARAGWRERHDVHISATRPLVEMSDAELLRAIEHADGELEEAGSLAELLDDP